MLNFVYLDIASKFQNYFHLLRKRRKRKEIPVQIQMQLTLGKRKGNKMKVTVTQSLMQITEGKEKIQIKLVIHLRLLQAESKTGAIIKHTRKEKISLEETNPLIGR